MIRCLKGFENKMRLNNSKSKFGNEQLMLAKKETVLLGKPGRPS